MIFHGFIINPDQYLIPSYKISPFSTQDVGQNNHFKESSVIRDYIRSRFPQRQFIFTENGRSAIGIALQSLNLNKNDYVTILTTTGNFYISSCVTREIEKKCKWSRKLETNTKALFVNHEFGFCYEDLISLKRFGFPIIEDCAHSFCSNNQEHSTGHVGDFVVFSLPKFFPIQIGGLLLYNQGCEITSKIDPECEKYITKVLSNWSDKIGIFSTRRKDNYCYLEEKFLKLGMSARFSLNDQSVPGVFMFSVDDDKIDLPKLKTFLWNQGVECSVFYGERSFFIPVHHRLKKMDLDYFYMTVEYFRSHFKDIQ